MTEARKIIDHENKKKYEEEFRLRSEYAALLHAANEKNHMLKIKVESEIKKKMEEKFAEIHKQITKGYQEAPLFSDMLKSIDELVDDFKNEILNNEINENGLKKVEALQNAVSTTFNPTIPSENKLKSIVAFQSLSQESLNKADQRIKRSLYLSALLFGLLAAALVGAFFATLGIGVLPLLVGAAVGFIGGSMLGGGVSLCRLSSWNSHLPSSLGVKLQQVSQRGFFAQKSTPVLKEGIASTPQACIA